MNYISTIISVIAILISGLTFWLTRLNKGQVKMTRPTVIFFGPDNPVSNHKKVFIRTLLYSSSEQGQYIQNMFVRLKRGESTQNFNIWVYEDNGLVRGSGLFVGKSGVASNHHFLTPVDGTKYEFLQGTYILEVYVESVNRTPKKIFQEQLDISEMQNEKMKNNVAGIYFDWAPNTQSYFAHIDQGPKESSEFQKLAEKFMKEGKIIK